MMFRSSIAAVAAGLVLVPAASAASPVQGSVFGPVVATKGSTFTITTSLSPSGKSVVSAASARITEQATAPRSSLKVGSCVMATGARSAKGVVTATRISISQPVKGQCGGGFFGRGVGGGTRPGGGPPPSGTRRPPTGGAAGGSGFRNGSFGFAFGSVTKLDGSTLTVKSAFGGTARTTTVTFTPKTTLGETKTVKVGDVALKSCAFVRGSSTDKGLTVKATDVAITPETNGKCTSGFRRPS
jgi:Domain of unknown function (DUF5666)